MCDTGMHWRSPDGSLRVYVRVCVRGRRGQAWRTLCELSRVEFQKIYDTLGVRLQERGESFYNPLLADVVR
jgi:arginyl-tRNA synthetase